MNFTSRSRYALKIMMHLAHNEGDPLVRRNDIAAEQGVPSDYLDQIMIRLRSAGLVESVRGRHGGYRLAVPSADISLWRVFESVEDSIYPAECLGEHSSCTFESNCNARSVWGKIFGAIRLPLETMTLQSVSSSWNEDIQLGSIPASRECRAGKSTSAVSRLKLAADRAIQL